MAYMAVPWSVWELNWAGQLDLHIESNVEYWLALKPFATLTRAKHVPD